MSYLFATPWTVACQAPLSMGFSREEYWSALPFPTPGDLPDPGIEPASPAWQADSWPLSHLGRPSWWWGRQQSGNKARIGILRSVVSTTQRWSLRSCFFPQFFAFSKSSSNLFLSPFCHLLSLLGWTGWRYSHLSREELREQIIWIDKSYSTGFIAFQELPPPYPPKQYSKVYAWVWTAPYQVFKMARSSPFKILLKEQWCLLNCIWFYFASIAVCQG